MAGLDLVKDFHAMVADVNSVELSPDERLLAVASSRGNLVWVFDASSGHWNWGTSMRSFQAVFSPDGTQLAAGDSVGSGGKIFCSETGALLRTLTGCAGFIGVAWSSAGIIASASDDKIVRLWNPDDGKCLRLLSGHAYGAFGVSFSPDGTRLASGSHDKTIRVWDVASGNCLHTLTGHTEGIWRVAFSPDGSKLASTSRDDTVRIWDPSSDFSCVRILAGAGGSNWPTIAWSPDSRILATANEKTLQLCDKEGAFILQAQNQASAVNVSRFSYEIVTGSKDGQISRWSSPMTSLFFDVKSSIPFGNLRPPSKFPHDVSRALERVSIIIERMDLPTALQGSISSLHDLNNPIFKDIEKKAKIAREIEQDFDRLISQRQSLREVLELLQIKAHEHAPLDDVKQDLSSIDSSMQSISEAIPIINKHLQNYAAIIPSSDTSSIKQHEHPSPKELSAKEIGEILAFSHISNANLSRLEHVVVDTGDKFEKALLEYDDYAGRIREQSEKNLDALNGFLAHLTRPSIASDRIHEIESILSKLQVQLDSEKNIMSELAVSLSSLSAATGKTNRMLQAEEEKGQKAKANIISSTENEGSTHSRIRVGGDGRQQSSAPPEVDSIEYLDQQLQQAKARLRSTSGIAHNPHLVYKWLHDHPDAKLDAGDIFDIIGIR